MGKVLVFAGAGCLAISALMAPAALEAQALQRSIYASALDQSGAPVPNLGPTDFVVREDKVAREILAVAPAVDPMQIALLVDNSQAGYCTPGSLIGEIGVLTGKPATDRVIATESSHYLALEREALHRLMKDRHRLCD